MKSTLAYLATSSSFQETKTPIWIASKFFLSRNLSSYPFPHKMSCSQKKHTSKILQKSLLKAPGLTEPFSLLGDQIRPIEKEFLHEHFFALDHFQKGDIQEDFIIDTSSSFLALINSQNHLILQSIAHQSEWGTAWNNLSKIEEYLTEIHDFAYSHKFGYLTAHPANCGTGLHIQALLHLPALNYLENLKEVLEREIEENIEVDGLGGGQEFIGDITIIKNRFSLGVSEDCILESVHKMATSLITLEKTARNLIIKKLPSIILDKISRSYALIKHSFQIDIKEAFEALSLIKLGINLNWIMGITDGQLTRALFKCQKAHMSLLFDEEITKEALSIKRAHFLQKELKNMTLNLP